MTDTTSDLTVLFADICSSTKYFRQHGDLEGRRIIMACLGHVADTVVGLGGKVIDRVGDELMCTNPDLMKSLQTGPAIQESVAAACAQGRLPADMQMRIGLHQGPVLVDGNRIFGDTVHTAKRLVDLAKCDQILTSRSTLSALEGHLQCQSRFVDRMRIKGQSEAVEIFELLGETSNLTYMTPARRPQTESYRSCLLQYERKELTVSEARPVVTIGRLPHCDLPLMHACVSREHARIEYQKGRIIYIDSSTNGTFVFEDSSTASILVRREQRWLRNAGSLRFGNSADDPTCLILRYVCL